MNNDFIPTIRITISSMKASIISCLGVKGSELGEVIEGRVDEVLKSHEFNESIDKEIHKVINSEIRSYFKYGNGNKAIRIAIEGSLDDMILVKEDSE